MYPSNRNVRGRRCDHSPFPSGVDTSDANGLCPVSCQRTTMNFPTAFATSRANFILVIGRRFLVWSVVQAWNAHETEAERKGLVDLDLRSPWRTSRKLQEEKVNYQGGLWLIPGSLTCNLIMI